MSCCSTDGSCSTSKTATTGAEGISLVYDVSGMTCGHCEETLTREIGALEGVLAVEVDLIAGQVSVTTADELDDALLEKVVDAAGYMLVGRAT